MTATSFEVNPNLSTSSNSLVNPNGANNDGLSGNQTAITQQIQLSHQQTHGGFLVPNSPSSSSSTSKNNGDTTFEPTVDMMVNDFDDEQTLEEEEALAARESEDPSAELSNLQKESDMPIEELLALYNCTSSVTSNNGTELSATSNSNDKCSTSGNSCTSLSNMNTKNNNNNGGNSHTINSNSINNGNNQNAGKSNSATSSLITVPSGGGRRIITTTTTKTTTGTVMGLTSTNSINHHDDNGGSTEPNGENDDDEELDEDDEVEIDEDDDDEFDDDESKEPPSQLRKLYPETYGNSSDKRLLRTISRQQSDEEDEGDYSPDEDEFKKTIMVGSEFQAMIAEGFFKYDDVLPYENEDKLLWDPSRLSEQQTEEYLQKVNQAKLQNQTSIVESIPQGNHLKDDEQALYLLLQCGHNTDEALRRKRINAVPTSEQMMSLWSEEECRNFESGIRIYGKDFHTIKHAKVRTRSVGELVQFYYLWKKTERHDVFANKARLEKKKYSLHPGLTDYMDRFLEEQDCNNCTTNHTNVNLRDRSLSPGANNSLLMADTKRISTLQHHHHHHQHQQMQQQQQQNAHIVNKSLNLGGNTDYSTATAAGSSSTASTTPANQMQDPLAVGDAEVFTGIKTLNNNSNSIINNKVTQQQHQQQQHIDSPTSSGSGSLSSLNADHNDTPDQ